MFSDGDCDRDDLSWLDVSKFRPRAAIDHARRQVKQHIDDTRHLSVKQPRIKLAQLGANAGQAGE